MSDPDRWEGLEEALDRYEAALESGRDRVVAEARLELCRVLLACGWEPPEVVVGQMLRDSALLHALEPVVAPPAVVLPEPRKAVSPVEVLQHLPG